VVYFVYIVTFVVYIVYFVVYIVYVMVYYIYIISLFWLFCLLLDIILIYLFVATYDLRVCILWHMICGMRLYAI